MKQNAAFFDLDGTLLSVNSGSLWVSRERRFGRISLMQYLEATAYLLAYKFNAIDIERAMERALKTIKGEREETVRQRTEQWYFEDVAWRIAPGAWSVLQTHRRQGDRLVLLTSCSPYEAELASEQLCLDGWLSSHYEVKEGVFTGKPAYPLCFGAGKVTYAEAYAAEHGVDLEQSYFYSDSVTDLPMLWRVGNPRVVNPDTALRKEAKKQGWPILDWRREKG